MGVLLHAEHSRLAELMIARIVRHNALLLVPARTIGIVAQLLSSAKAVMFRGNTVPLNGQVSPWFSLSARLKKARAMYQSASVVLGDIPRTTATS